MDAVRRLLAFLVHGPMWYRLKGDNPGGMHAPPDSEWRRHGDDPYFREYIEEGGYAYLPPDDLRRRVRSYEAWACPPHLTLEQRRSWRKPRC